MIWLLVAAAWAALSAAFVTGWACAIEWRRRRPQGGWQKEAWGLYDKTELPASWPDHPQCPGC